MHGGAGVGAAVLQLRGVLPRRVHFLQGAGRRGAQGGGTGGVPVSTRQWTAAPLRSLHLLLTSAGSRTGSGVSQDKGFGSTKLGHHLQQRLVCVAHGAEWATQSPLIAASCVWGALKKDRSATWQSKLAAACDRRKATSGLKLCLPICERISEVTITED